MDDRQTKIREGAGLEDSRINQEFLDFLNKWSSPVLLVLAVAALVWAGLQYLERKKNANIDQAYSELESATMSGNASPASLKTIASEYGGTRAVPELALLRACDIELNAFIVGIKPGAQINPQTGALVDENDQLSDDERQGYLNSAAQSAQKVFDLTNGKPGKALLTIEALTRLAAVREGERDFEGAKSLYEQLGALAQEQKYPTMVALAERRIERLGEFESVTPLPNRDQLAPLPGEVSPELTQEQLNELLQNAMENQPATESDPEADAQNSESEPEASPADEPSTNGDEPQGQEPSTDSP